MAEPEAQCTILFLYMCEIFHNTKQTLCCMNSQVNTPFPLALPITRHLLFGLGLPFGYKTEYSLYRRILTLS